MLHRILTHSRTLFCAGNVQALIPRNWCFTKHRLTFFNKHVGVNVMPLFLSIVVFITPLRILLQYRLVCRNVLIFWGRSNFSYFGAGWTFLVTLGFSLTLIYNRIGVLFVVFSESINCNNLFLCLWRAEMNCKFGGAMQAMCLVTGLFCWRQNFNK